MLKFIEEFSYEERYFQDSRYGWIEEIENTNLVKKIKNLNISEIEILTMYVFEEKSQTERVIGQKVLMELSPNSMDNHWIYEIHSI